MSPIRDPARPHLLATSYALALTYAGIFAPALVPGSVKAHLGAAVLAAASVAVADMPEKWRALAKRVVVVVRRIVRMFR